MLTGNINLSTCSSLYLKSLTILFRSLFKINFILHWNFHMIDGEFKRDLEPGGNSGHQKSADITQDSSKTMSTSTARKIRSSKK